jgi:hypothetical protein
MIDTSYEQEMEEFIRQVFEENYEQLRLESGHAISADVKETALNQVLLYWRKLREVAENVTDTEVRLSLPGQESPRGREYTIDGVVDIVREQDRTLMYDVKTHEADFVRANIDLYEQQLNVYAHIWQELRHEPLDESAIIATNYPDSVQEALSSGDPTYIAYTLEQWEPVIPIDFDPSRVYRTINEFGQVVDNIEDGQFRPPSVDKLNELLFGARRERFATRVCRNCDARFSCSSYRQYAWFGKGVAERRMAEYFADPPGGIEQEEWRSANLDATPGSSELTADL